MSARASGSCLIAALVVGALSLFASLAGAKPASAMSAVAQEARAKQLGLDAYVYGIPLMEFVRQDRTQTSVTVPNDLSDAPTNQLGSARQLATVAHQVIVQPNLDTLYTMAHLDLSGGPLVLHVPRVPGHRYYEFQLLDPYTNVFHYVGTRTTGNGPGTFAITGPSFRGTLPRGLRRIRSAYEHVWVVARTEVYGPGDLAAVHRIQNGYRLVPLVQFLAHGLSWRPPRPHRIVARHTTFKIPTGVAFFDQLGTALAENPPPARDKPILRELRTVGIGPGLHPSREHLSAPVLAGLRAAGNAGASYIYELRLELATPNVLAHNGWFVPPADTGAYGTDYRLRAIISVYGLAANRPAEALYIVAAADQTHTLLNAAHDYVIHFRAGQLPPARYFWSLTMYDQDFFLAPNALGRYALGSHTPTLKRNPDGSLDVYIQHSRPAGHESNWLPAPASGQFEVTLRLYGPLPRALNGSYVYPPIIRTS